MTKKEAKVLLGKYLAGKCSADEIAALEAWYLQYEQKYLPDVAERLNEEQLARIRQTLVLHIDNASADKKRIFLWPRTAAAASILLFLSIGGYFLLHKQPRQQTAQSKKQDILPGRNQATLTLANGQKIILNKGLNGELAQQGNMRIHVNRGNTIAYTATTGNKENTGVLYNTLSTKRGEQSPYPLVLADGTKVWLDAASSITFPTAFEGNERLVKITGQAMLEVAHDPSHPFRVTVKGQTIEDIGTVFNINAYDDEPNIKTTLISGEVKVYFNNAASSAVRLKPGQQTVLNDKTLSINQADIEEVSAWHNGLFEFHSADVPTVMRQLARWYDVDVNYEGSIPKAHFSGNIYRNVSALKVLDILSFEKIHFRIEGKKIIVEP